MDHATHPPTSPVPGNSSNSVSASRTPHETAAAVAYPPNVASHTPAYYGPGYSLNYRPGFVFAPQKMPAFSPVAEWPPPGFLPTQVFPLPGLPPRGPSPPGLPQSGLLPLGLPRQVLLLSVLPPSELAPPGLPFQKPPVWIQDPNNQSLSPGADSDADSDDYVHLPGSRTRPPSGQKSASPPPRTPTPPPPPPPPPPTRRFCTLADQNILRTLPVRGPLYTTFPAARNMKYREWATKIKEGYGLRHAGLCCGFWRDPQGSFWVVHCDEGWFLFTREWEWCILLGRTILRAQAALRIGGDQMEKAEGGWCMWGVESGYDPRGDERLRVLWNEKKKRAQEDKEERERLEQVEMDVRAKLKAKLKKDEKAKEEEENWWNAPPPPPGSTGWDNMDQLQ